MQSAVNIELALSESYSGTLDIMPTLVLSLLSALLVVTAVVLLMGLPAIYSKERLPNFSVSPTRWVGGWVGPSDKTDVGVMQYASFLLRVVPLQKADELEVRCGRQYFGKPRSFIAVVKVFCVRFAVGG